MQLATRTILGEHPEIAILIVTMFEDDESVFAAMRAGARAYLLKDANQQELSQAVYAVSRGQAIFSPTIAQRLIHYFGAYFYGRIGILLAKSALHRECSERRAMSRLRPLPGQPVGNSSQVERNVLGLRVACRTC